MLTYQQIDNIFSIHRPNSQLWREIKTLLEIDQTIITHHCTRSQQVMVDGSTCTSWSKTIKWLTNLPKEKLIYTGMDQSFLAPSLFIFFLPFCLIILLTPKKSSILFNCQSPAHLEVFLSGRLPFIFIIWCSVIFALLLHDSFSKKFPFCYWVSRARA